MVRWLRTFEHTIIRALIYMMAIIILISTIELGYLLVKDIVNSRFQKNRPPTQVMILHLNGVLEFYSGPDIDRIKDEMGKFLMETVEKQFLFYVPLARFFELIEIPRKGGEKSRYNNLLQKAKNIDFEVHKEAVLRARKRITKNRFFAIYNYNVDLPDGQKYNISGKEVNLFVRIISETLIKYPNERCVKYVN